MCGRARCSLAREAVAAAAGVADGRWRDGGHYQPSYNCSPGAWLPVICLGSDGGRELRTMKWGLVPSFIRLAPSERPDHYRMFNARCESLADKPVFSRLLPRRRCVAVLNGFYEWLSQGSTRKQPYYISTANDPECSAMYLAGLYDVYKDPNGEPLYTFTVVTTDSSKKLAWLHDRMPVILETLEEVAEWLGEYRTTTATPSTTQSGPEQTNTHAATTIVTASGSSSPMGQDVLQGTARPTSLGTQEIPGEGPCMGVSPVQAHGGAGGGGSGRDDADRHDTAACGSQGSGGDGGSKAAVDIDLTQTSDAEEEGSGAGGGGVKQLHGSEDEGTGMHASGAVRRHGGKGHGGGEEGARQDYSALVGKLCRPYGGPLLRWHPVTPEMGKPGYDKPDACQDVRTKKGSIASFFKPPARVSASSSAAAVGKSPAATINGSAKGKTESSNAEPSLSLGAGLGAAASGPSRTAAGTPCASRLAVKKEVLGTPQEKGNATEAKNPDECPDASGGASAEAGEGGAVGGEAGGHKRSAEGSADGDQDIQVKKKR